MAKIAKKCRLCRREGAKLFLKGMRCFSPKCPIERKGAVPPGIHGMRRTRRLSEYAIQLREKQKAKRLYGIGESQFKKYFLEATKQEGDRGENLLIMLETRLDNVLYRLGLAPSRTTARQLISHGHVWVNNKRVKIPSYRVSVGDRIIFTRKGWGINYIQEWMARGEVKPPKWLKRLDRGGKVVSLPTRDHIPSDVEESLVVEFYSR
jgi:small subunit ribosomal protein S4